MLTDRIINYAISAGFNVIFMHPYDRKVVSVSKPEVIVGGFAAKVFEDGQTIADVLRCVEIRAGGKLRTIPVKQVVLPSFEISAIGKTEKLCEDNFARAVRKKLFRLSSELYSNGYSPSSLQSIVAFAGFNSKPARIKVKGKTYYQLYNSVCMGAVK